MMKLLRAPVVVVVALLSAAAPLSAHHSWPVNTSRLVTVKGAVTELVWQNPTARRSSGSSAWCWPTVGSCASTPGRLGGARIQLDRNQRLRYRGFIVAPMRNMFSSA